MPIRFNPPPLWRSHLPNDFIPAVDWIPERAWGAPPVGWPMWVDSATGMAAEPPAQYQQNPYLYMSIMPDWDALENNSTLAAAVDAAPRNPRRQPLSRGKKIGLGVVAGLVVIGVIGALGGGGDAGQDPVAATPSASMSEGNASIELADEPSGDSSVVSEAEESAKQAAEEQEKKDAAEASAKAEAEEKEKAEAEKKEKAEAEASAKAEAEAAAAKAEEEAGTVSQQNALRKAADYLEYTAFSKSGLIDQLEFEGYSKSEAEWAVERVTVDWNEQAALKAADYLDYTAFSKSGLIDQLMYEGFTKKQATYGVSTTGL